MLNMITLLHRYNFITADDVALLLLGLCFRQLLVHRNRVAWKFKHHWNLSFLFILLLFFIFFLCNLNALVYGLSHESDQQSCEKSVQVHVREYWKHHSSDLRARKSRGHHNACKSVINKYHLGFLWVSQPKVDEESPKGRNKSCERGQCDSWFSRKTEQGHGERDHETATANAGNCKAHLK